MALPQESLPQQAVVRVLPFVQRYAWGCPADTAVVAALAKRTKGCINYDAQEEASREQQGGSTDSRPFAELWIGTHPNGCAYVMPVEADAFLSRGPQRQVTAPSHPDRALAARLHAEQPLEYRDANHKPEMAIAIGEFAALAGFRQPAAVAALLQQTPELRQALGQQFMQSDVGRKFQTLPQQQHQDGKEAAHMLKAAFAALLQIDLEQNQQAHSRIREQQAALKDLHARLLKEPPPDPTRASQPQLQQEAEWVALQLLQAYPADIGCFAAFFLNLVLLKDGEALFIPPNYLHCYLKELMATSDNVIRGGLTSKKVDAPLLLQSLDFSPLLQAPARTFPAAMPQGAEEQLTLLRRLCMPPTDSSPQEQQQVQQQEQQQEQQQVQQQQEQCCLYHPPLWRFPEFCTARVSLPLGCSRSLELLHRTPGVLLVLWAPFRAAMRIHSKSHEVAVCLRTGDIFYIAAEATVVLDCTQLEAEDGVKNPTQRETARDGLAKLLLQHDNPEPNRHNLLAFLVTGGITEHLLQ
ncbi:mannose-6-phosphate isomerase isoform x2 [Cyclospora cayetanensis]|uniref:Mannose-6-phosphate isomerase isoform x2 n=1 Tax=Cyclospora cayetanensis TaxID=88456 RepID=A0A1D3D698_9EIME|nr:mannose-6-phosphate isomerase isoform x2 [Cyclospora cayetanensis]